MGKNTKPQCVIIGGGGHARVLIDCLRITSPKVALAILDADKNLWGKTLSGIAIIGGDDQLKVLRQRGARYFIVGVGGIGNNTPRRRLFEKALALGLKPWPVIHPTAYCSKEAQLGPGCQLLPKSVVNAGARLGSNVIVNSGAIVEHDCVIGDHAHIASGACLSSAVIVGPLSHIGCGATVKQCVEIGEGSIVGAGAAVVHSVAAFSVVIGVPARPLPRIPASTSSKGIS